MKGPSDALSYANRPRVILKYLGQIAFVLVLWSMVPLMEKEQVRRLLVTDKTKHTVGIFSLGDLARKSQDDRLTGRLLHEISAIYARAAT